MVKWYQQTRKSRNVASVDRLETFDGRFVRRSQTESLGHKVEHFCVFLSCLKVDYVHARPTSLVPISRVLSACVARLLLFLFISFFFSSGLISRVVLKVKWPYISSRRYGQIFFSLDYLIYFHECFWQIFSYELWSRKWDDTDYVLAYVLVQVLLMNKFLIFPQERVRTSNHIRVSPSSSSLSLPSSHVDQLHPDHLSAVKASKLVSLNLRFSK